MKQSSICRPKSVAMTICLISATMASPLVLAAQCPTNGTGTSESCEGPIKSALSQARSEFGASCPGLSIRDCDRTGGGWQCSSAVIGSNAPGGVSAAESCNEITANAQSPVAAESEPPAAVSYPVSTPAPQVAPQATPQAAPQATPQAIAENSDEMTASVNLIVGLSDSERYGHRYANANERLTLAGFTFDGGSETLTLTVTGYDIDYVDEVEVLVNGEGVGYLTTSPDNGASVTSLPINASEQRSGSNTLEFRERVSGWRWGVTDIMLTVGCNYPLVQN